MNTETNSSKIEVETSQQQLPNQQKGQNSENIKSILKQQSQQQQQQQQTGQPGKGNQKNIRATNQKNTYIKKISTLIEKHTPADGNLPPEIETGSQKVKRNKSQINIDNINDEDKDKMKLARNRESARNSRKRKKIYLELLENKVTQLNDFLQESKQINSNSEKLLGDLQKQIRYKNEMASQKQVLFRNMQMALQSSASEVNINGIIDSLKQKYGTVNEERMDVLDYCYKQIQEQMLPIHMRYILYACKNKKDIFEEHQSNGQKSMIKDQEKQEEEFPNIIKGLNFNDQQKKKCQKLSKFLIKEKNKMDQLLIQLDEAKDQMKKELNSLDNTFEELRKDFDPSHIGKFLMEIEKFQYNKNMKQSFNKFFYSKQPNEQVGFIDEEEGIDDWESEGDLYEFIKSEDSCNNLMVDINQAYDVYVDAYDFLSKKQQMQKDEKQQQ